MDSRQPRDTGSANGRTSGLTGQPTQPRASRRTVLRRGGVVAAASVAGLSLLDQHSAEASTGDYFILGQANSADTTTQLSVMTSGTQLTPMFMIDGSGLGANSTTVTVDGPNAGGLALAANGSGSTGGISGTSGTGTGVAGTSGAGRGVTGTSTSNSGVAGSSGSGPGVSGTSTSGIGVTGSGERGGTFRGKLANIQLPPSSGSHPESGSKGDLFVDHNAHLWFCQGGTMWVKLA